MALDHREFLPLAGRLSDRWRVLLWDMPGHGESLPQPRDYSVAAMTDALEAVMAAAGARRVVLLGFSFGGAVAQVFAQRHPEQVRALIAYACIAPYDQPAPVPSPLVGPAVAALFGRKSWPVLRRDFAKACARTPVARAHVEAAMAPLGKAGFLAMTRALLRAHGAAPGPRFAGPVLIVAGDSDSNKALLDRAAAGLRAAHPGAERRSIPDAGHCAHLDAPKAFEAVITEFLSRLPDRPLSRPD